MRYVKKRIQGGPRVYTAAEAAEAIRPSGEISVAVPAGVQGGETFELDVPGRGVMVLAVPMGLEPGQIFQYQLPPLQGE